MSQEQNGENSSAREQLAKFESILDEYQLELGLDNIQYNAEIIPILSLKESQLKNLDQAGCNEYAFLLNQYAALLNKEINRHNVRLFWATEKLNEVVARSYNDHSSSSYDRYELVKYRVINNNSAAQALQQIIKHSKARKLELENIAYSVESMSKTLITIGRSK